MVILQSPIYLSKNVIAFVYLFVNVSLDPFNSNTLNTYELKNDNIYPILLYLWNVHRVQKCHYELHKEDFGWCLVQW